ncbi:hypothetical protein F383_20293 [Gossypium arboreum]|uniref:Uncharacterized protein n=1 Tax=Gossypium arboreum TaxID=29729 RepID=A0A0B0NHZ9_GOSAR|nr:hypothetical protein F383_20293 [Gossypium arboreum]
MTWTSSHEQTTQPCQIVKSKHDSRTCHTGVSLSIPSLVQFGNGKF